MTLFAWRNSVLLKQEEVSDKMGVTIGTISLVERGKINPTIIFKRKFLETFGKKVYIQIDEFKAS